MFGYGVESSTMPYSALAVANHFLDVAERHGVSLSPMKIIKLVYIAHGWCLATTDEEPLLDEAVEAWPYGPVIPSIYHEFKEFGDQPVARRAIQLKLWHGVLKKIIQPELPKNAAKAQEIIAVVWDEYGALSAIRLSTLTHQPGTPWHQVWTQGGGKFARGLDIPNPLIAKHYRDLATAAA